MWHKVFYRYLISYLAIFLVPFIVFTYLIVSVFLRDFRDKAVAEEEALVRQAVDSVDYELAAVERTVHSVSRNRYFLPEIINMSPYYPIETIQELVMYRDQGSLFFDILYTPMGSRRTYGSLSSYVTKDIPESVYQVPGIDEAAYRRNVSAVPQPLLEGVERVRFFRGDWNEKRLFLAFYPVPLNMAMPYGTLFFLIYPDILFQKVDWLLEHRNGSLVIEDPRGTPIYTQNGRDGGGKKTTGQAGTVREENIAPRERGTVEWKLQSKYTGWTYIWTFPEATSFAQVKILEQRFLLGVLLCVFFSIGVIALVMNANYRPLVVLKRTLEDELHREIGRSRGLDGLNQLIHVLLDRNMSLEEMVRNSTDLFKEKLLRGIITREFDNLEIERICARIGFPFNHEHYRIAALSPYSPAVLSSDWLKNGIVFLGRYFEVHPDRQPYDSAVRENDSCIRGYLSFSRYLVLVMAYDDLFMESEITALLAELENAIGIKIVCGVGNEYPDRRDLSISCRQAVMSLEENIHSREQPLLRYGELASRSDWPMATRKELLEQLRGDMLSANIDDWNECMDGLHTHIARNPHSLSVTRHFLANVYESAQMAIPGLRKRYPDLPGWESLYEMTTDEEILMFVDELKERVAALLSEIREENVVGSVTAFIRERYHDPNLSVEEIAREMNLSYSYLSRSFKARTGVGLNEYLIRFRIGKFKELASHTDESISSLILKVGYRGTYQFGRAFKKHEGLPPSEFRKLLTKSRNLP